MENGTQRDIINKAIEVLRHISSQQAQENISSLNQDTQLEVAALKQQQQMRRQLPTEGE